MQQPHMEINESVWFSQLDTEIKLLPEDLKTFEQVIAQSFATNKFNSKNLQINDFAPRIIFLSIAQPEITATVIHGKGYGLISALQDAFYKAQARFNFKEDQYMVKIDIVTRAHLKKDYEQNDKLDFIKGIEGIAFAEEFDLAILPEQVAYNYLWDDDKKILSNRLYNYLEKNPPESWKLANVLRQEKMDVYLFTTESFLLENKHLTPLYRGQRRYESFSRQDLKEAINAGGKYLIRAITASGRYDYQYHVDANFLARDYNFLRHAGTCFSLVEYLEFSKDQEALPALQRAFSYMKLFAAPGLEDPETTCFVERGLVKVGGNGLAALALAKYMKVTGDKSEKELLHKICNWILTQTKGNGDFKGHKQYYHNGKYSKETVLYYPGEVIYGLVSAYHLFQESAWLETANRIAHWMINIRDHGIESINLEHDHWLLYGLNELYRLTPHKIYLEHAAKICHAIIYKQILKSPTPDYFGAHNNNGDPSSTQTATRSEGLFAAYKLLRDHEQPSIFTTKVYETAKRCVSFQLRTQYNAVNSMYVHDIAKTLGGFRSSIGDHDVRIDYVQHNISSLISLYNILQDENKKAAEDEQIALYKFV